MKSNGAFLRTLTLPRRIITARIHYRYRMGILCRANSCTLSYASVCRIITSLIHSRYRTGTIVCHAHSTSLSYGYIVCRAHSSHNAVCVCLSNHHHPRSFSLSYGCIVSACVIMIRYSTHHTTPPPHTARCSCSSQLQLLGRHQDAVEVGVHPVPRPHHAPGPNTPSRLTSTRLLAHSVPGMRMRRVCTGTQ